MESNNTAVSIDHFLVTLFNLRLWRDDKSGRATLTDEWLESRCDLFERYCLPSVESQTCKDFTWLLMLDAESPAWLRERVARWQSQCPQLKPCFFTAEEVAGFAEPSVNRQINWLRRAIKECNPRATHLVTTNLDNDDALHCDTIKRIRRACLEARDSVDKPHVISLINGLQYFPAWHSVMSMRYPHNHFLTLMEPATAAPITIESLSHRHARRLYNVTDVGGQAAWIEVVHGSNVSNELRITSRIRYTPLLHRIDLSPFGIAVSYSRASQLKSTARTFLYFFKVASWRLKRKLSHKK